MQRRTYLAGLGTVGATALAGCGSDDGDDTQNVASGGSASGGSSGSGDSGGSQSETIVDDNDTVTEDHYRTYTFTLNQKAHLSLVTTVRTGPHVDFVFMTQDELEHYENNERFRYDEELSAMDSVGVNRSPDTPYATGDYALVVDNTDMTGVEPPTNGKDNAATYDVKFTAQAD
ncbi:hypothetical protein MBEHAL_2563 [Halarchaeum acidiphilum MH1-52-1]|uniref:Uncharacterized protein n=1 Tax=Halarchaeum acidiphilum MH1-52-1 TaxID=1261545 RepID=U3AG89_9EURY|nr:hypothetical protein [Halarchaeum acidiphilum]GAD53803.1 hypothetical protein MBEHAL_2563 [Halarchaeum acidiphilum MH1-52-1]